MHPNPLTLCLQPAPEGGCGDCLPSASGPRCQVHFGGKPCPHPQLAGCAELIGRVMDELDRSVVVPDAGRGIVELQWVQSLRIEDGEAELTLTFPTHCGPGRQLADSAFQTLRRLLPDTDVYIRHAP